MSGVHQTTIDSYDPVRAVEYGQLVQLAYDMYGNGQSPTPAPPAPFQDAGHCRLDRGWPDRL
jgi:hypothetical protein